MAPPTRATIDQLRRRLARVERQPSSLRRNLQNLNGRRFAPPGQAGHALCDRLEGEWIRRPSGEVLAVDRFFPLFHRQGKLALDSLCRLRARSVHRLAGRSFGFDPRRTLFLDTECTGLSAGAGTFVFLVGVGHLEGDEFRTRQLFLPGFESEKTLLEELIELLGGRFTTLVTFNGKSFDLNLLANRYTLQRLEEPFSSLLHLDLLFPCRVLWRNRFGSCSLQTLERRVLGFERRDDIPSALIPRTYFEYLRGGPCRPLGKVLDHNRLDLLSMVPLLALLGRAMERPDPRFDVDPLAAARLCVLRGAWRQAVRVLESSRRSGRCSAFHSEMTLQLAWLRKRLGHRRKALQLWQELIRDQAGPPREAFREAAKILEHLERELKPALEVVEQGLRLYPDSEDLRHRRHRLQCKIDGKRWY